MENESLNLDAPYSLADIEEQHRRLLLLNLPHMAPLTHYLDEIRREDGDHLTIPNFDPCDGGVNAKGLFLLDSPDYAAVGSGFVSRNNMDHASKNLCIFMQRAGIDRRDTLIWNLTPWRLTFGDDPVTDRAFSLLLYFPLNDLDKKKVMGSKRDNLVFGQNRCHRNPLPWRIIP